MMKNPSYEMAMLFCLLICYKDIEKDMLNNYKELNPKPTHNNIIVAPKNNKVCSY